jgi:hypothetical protein
MQRKRHPRKRAGIGGAFGAAGDVAFGAGGDVSGVGQPIVFVALGIWWSIVGIPQSHPAHDASSPPSDSR